jgi:hypothetical protein
MGAPEELVESADGYTESSTRVEQEVREATFGGR